MEIYTLVYSTSHKIVLVFQEKGNDVTTTHGASAMFEGTREECLTKIAELGLTLPEGEE